MKSVPEISKQGKKVEHGDKNHIFRSAGNLQRNKHAESKIEKNDMQFRNSFQPRAVPQSSRLVRFQ